MVAKTCMCMNDILEAFYQLLALIFEFVSDAFAFRGGAHSGKATRSEYTINPKDVNMAATISQ